jgi:hypothetical protein
LDKREKDAKTMVWLADAFRLGCPGLCHCQSEPPASGGAV